MKFLDCKLKFILLHLCLQAVHCLLRIGLSEFPAHLFCPVVLRTNR